MKYKGKLTNLKEPPQIQFHIYHNAWEEIFRLPYVKPTDETYDFFEKLAQDPKTSSDTFAHLIKAAYDYMLKFLALQRIIIDLDEIITNPNIKSMKMKTEEFIRIINDNLADVEISHLILRNIYELVVEGLAIYDPDPFSGLHDACRCLQANLNNINDRIARVENEPPKMTIEAKRSPLIELLEKKAMADKRKEGFEAPPKTSFGMGALSRIYGSDASFTQIAADYEQEQNERIHNDDLIDLTEIWIEIDPITDRLIDLKETKVHSEVECQSCNHRV